MTALKFPSTFQFPKSKPDPVKPPENYQGPQNPLQKHVAFFDGRDDKPADGIVTVAETTAGLKKLGLSDGWAKFAGTVINKGLGPSTNGNQGSTVVIPEIGKATHHGDSGSFKADGNLAENAVKQMLGTYDTNGDHVFSMTEIHAMQEKRAAQDPDGYVKTKLEWGLLMAIGSDVATKEDGKVVPGLSEDRLKSFFDGNFFYDLEKAPVAQQFDSKLFVREMKEGVAGAGKRVEESVHQKIAAEPAKLEELLGTALEKLDKKK